MKILKNYYVGAFFWSTLQKVLAAIVGLLTVPLLLSHFGREEYGVLSIATACNGYLHLLDLGMNTGAVRYFSIWKAKGDTDMMHRVARTNLTFYGIVALINIAVLLVVAFFGRNFFTLTDSQFQQFQSCLFIIALFCIFSWGTTTYNQLLVADKRMDFTAQMQCVATLLKLALIWFVFRFNMMLSAYFFWLTALGAVLIVPYAVKCKAGGLIDSHRPAFYWKDFRVVLTFSLSIFALSLFQTTATQSRPIILGIFSDVGPLVNTEFRILEVVPTFIIALGSTFSGIFLPKTSEMVARGNQREIEQFAYKWARLTSVIMCAICFPFILCSNEVICAYVGEEYSYLSTWLAVWCVTVLIQMHTTPGNALVLAYGKTKDLVIVTSINCVVSMIINAVLCKHLQVGSAIIGYFAYVVVIMGLYYLYFYKKLLLLNRWQMLSRFVYPALAALACMLAIRFFPWQIDCGQLFDNTRVNYIAKCIIKSSVWLAMYAATIRIFHIVDFKELINKK